jgi:hypothetical protein
MDRIETVLSCLEGSSKKTISKEVEKLKNKINDNQVSRVEKVLDEDIIIYPTIDSNGYSVFMVKSPRDEPEIKQVLTKEGVKERKIYHKKYKIYQGEECTCPDYTFNCEDSMVCKHIWKKRIGVKYSALPKKIPDDILAWIADEIEKDFNQLEKTPPDDYVRKIFESDSIEKAHMIRRKLIMDYLD